MLSLLDAGARRPLGRWSPVWSTLLLTAVALPALPTAAGPAVRPAGGVAAVLDENFADPHVSRFGDTYYAYSTQTGSQLPVSRASSINGPWSMPAEAMASLGRWATAGRTGAPAVTRRPDGKYLLYYSAHSVSPDVQCIGTELAEDPAGPFVPTGDGPIVCDAAEGGDIDASSFVDTDGRRYLVYKSDGNSRGLTTHLWLQEVAADGVTFIGNRTALLHNDQEREHGVIEAPVLVRRPSQYVLFYSASSYYDGSYFTGYAVSTTLRGSYTKAPRPLLTTETFDGAVIGPGGADVVSEPGGDHLVFHGNTGFGRAMYVVELGWVNDNPVVRGSRVRP